MSQQDKFREEILKNSKYAKFFLQDESEIAKTPEIKIEDKNITKTLYEAKEENKKLDQTFFKLRKSNPHVLADLEAEEHMQNLKDIGEYNRWSLKLVQKWLGGFYTGIVN